MNKIIEYIKAILVPVIVGALVGIIISGSIDYNSLPKPPLAPSSGLFPVIWTILYILMGISYGILKSNNLTNEKTDSIYYSQLLVNALWSIFFFVLKWRLFSFLWIVLLAVLVFYMIKVFYKQNRLAGLLQIPYFIWTIFASYLNIAIYLLMS